MRTTILAFAVVSLLGVSLTAAAADSCKFSAPRNAELDAAGLKSLLVQIGPDDLVLHGEPGASKVVVRGTACASSQDRLQNVKLEAVRHGDTASVIAHADEHGIHISLFGGSYAYLKLDVSVPQTLAVKLQEGSGDAHASKLAALDATVGSGDLKVDGIAGQLGLRVGSGDVEASDVGSLNVSAVGSGDVSVDGVHGDAQVGSIGSGDFGVSNVKGNATLGSLASGDAKLATVGGSVSVQSVGSGDLQILGVTGNVSVGSVASGDIEVKQVGGNVHAGSVGSGDFNVNGVAGDLSVGSVGSGDVSHHGVKGKVSVPRDDD
ncbi:MAG TPA: DUF4097 family beta strand repeat-containing protein [Rhodanobacteraceae bacterium]|nr:DUF4097 family beta strand repeat-containing protein [Rhodanobacteraceae bacterium]